MPIVRLYHKGDVSLKPVKERYMAEIRDATPSVPMVRCIPCRFGSSIDLWIWT